VYRFLIRTACNHVHDGVLGTPSLQQRSHYTLYVELRTFCETTQHMQCATTCTAGMLGALWIYPHQYHTSCVSLFNTHSMQSRARWGAGHTLTLYTLCDYSTRAGCSHMHSWHAGRTLDITVLTPHKLCTTFQYAQYAITCTTGCWAHPHCNNDHITHFMWNYAPFVKLLNTCSVRPHARLACWAHSGYTHTNTTMVGGLCYNSLYRPTIGYFSVF